jgi:hypothetical protein
MISLKKLQNAYFWVFFIFYMYEMLGVLFWDHSFTGALDNLIAEFGPAIYIYLFILYNINFQEKNNENSILTNPSEGDLQ